MEARRYNKGKLRYELISKIANEEKAKVYTLGAHKYTLYKDLEGNIIKGSDISLSEASNYEIYDDGANNWKKGLPATDVLESLRRHIEAYAKGEDYDPDLGTFHLANAAWNIDVLLEQYKTHPELDNRQHKYLNMPKIGLDIDDVICGFVPAFMQKFGLEQPYNWAWSYESSKHFQYLIDHPDEAEEFYLNLPRLVDPNTLGFEPHCYITARSIPSPELTSRWIEKNGFACNPIYTIGHNQSKVEIAKQAGIDIFVDDRYENFVELNNAGICCYLFDAPHNQRYDVGHKRLYNLNDLV